MTDKNHPLIESLRAFSSKPLPPPSGRESLPAWVKMDNAKQEEKYWADEDKLRGAKQKNDLLWLRYYGWVIVALMVFFVVVFIVTLGVWVIHHITPWSWLTADQLSKIQSVIFSGSLGAIVSAFMQKQLSK